MKTSASGQLQLADDFEQPGGIVRTGIDQALPQAEPDATPPQFCDEPIGHPGGQARVMATRGKVDHPIFSDDDIDEMEVARHATQVFKDASGDEQHDDACGARSG